jgi:hypothetical protein
VINYEDNIATFVHKASEETHGTAAGATMVEWI